MIIHIYRDGPTVGQAATPAGSEGLAGTDPVTPLWLPLLINFMLFTKRDEEKREGDDRRKREIRK